MKLTELLAKAQLEAPAYLLLEEDGDRYKCSDCGTKYYGSAMYKCFTPDGISHYPVCIDCIDPEWLMAAKNLTALWGEKI